MKKIISILLTSILIVSLCIPAIASETLLTADTKIDTATGGIVVYGTAKSSRSGFMLTMEIKDSKGNIVYVDNIAVGYDKYNDAKTHLSYEFPAAVLHPKYPSDNYTIEVSGDKIGKAPVIPYEFKGADIQFAAISGVQAAIDKESESDLSKALGFDSDGADLSSLLGINRDSFIKLGEDGKDVFFELMMSKTYEVPENLTSDADIELVSSSMAMLRTDYLEAVVIGEFNDIASDAAAEKWLADYGKDFSADDKETAADESKLYPYITDALTCEGNFSQKLAAAGKIDSLEAIKTAFYENALLTILKFRHYSESYKIFDDFPEIFGIDTEAFSKLDPDEQGEVYAAACIDHDSVKDAGEYFDALVAPYLESGSDSSSSGSKGGGGFSVSTGSDKDEDKKEEKEEAAQSKIFPDVAQSMWAYNAIAYLKDAGIVNGDANGNFNPNSNITRAEYIKLVVMALGFDLSGESSAFTDVADNAWFKPYIDAAFANGLITGDDKNRAKPNDLITRQDMSVILYRAFELGESNTALTFADSDQISEYARKAVAALSQKGIVNGVGANSFAPKANATRAQAAQIIYNMLSSVR